MLDDYGKLVKQKLVEMKNIHQEFNFGSNDFVLRES